MSLHSKRIMTDATRRSLDHDTHGHVSKLELNFLHTHVATNCSSLMCFDAQLQDPNHPSATTFQIPLFLLSFVVCMPVLRWCPAGEGEVPHLQLDGSPVRRCRNS